jgi:hypothetical protein
MEAMRVFRVLNQKNKLQNNQNTASIFRVSGNLPFLFYIKSIYIIPCEI